MSTALLAASAVTVAVTVLAVRAARRDARSRAAQHAAYTTWQATGHGSRGWSWHWVWADTASTPGHGLTAGTASGGARVTGVEVTDLDDSEGDARGAREARSPGYHALAVGRTVPGDVVSVLDHPHRRRGPLTLARGVRVNHRVCGSVGCTRRGRYTFPSLVTCPGCTGPMTAVRGWAR